MTLQENAPFPEYPRLRKIAHSERYGRMELIEVNETSDGFLMGHAMIGTGDSAYCHSVFLGAVSDFK